MLTNVARPSGSRTETVQQITGNPVLNYFQNVIQIRYFEEPIKQMTLKMANQVQWAHLNRHITTLLPHISPALFRVFRVLFRSVCPSAEWCRKPDERSQMRRKRFVIRSDHNTIVSMLERIERGEGHKINHKIIKIWVIFDGYNALAKVETSLTTLLELHQTQKFKTSVI